MRSRLVYLAVVVAWMASLACSSAFARDWFVSAAAEPGGDGSKAKPFHDPYVALEQVDPGDTIHIAAGNYYGRLDSAHWEIRSPRLTLLGGYKPDFSARDPWTFPTVLAAPKDLAGVNELSMVNGRDDHSGAILDGLVVDGGNRNSYLGDGKFADFLRGLGGPMVTLSSPGVVIRNCTFINGCDGAVVLSGDGSRFENNLVLNHVGLTALNIRNGAGSGDHPPILVKGNTFAFAHEQTDPPMGSAADRATLIRVSGPAKIEDNVLLGGVNFAVDAFAKPADVTLERNVFWLDVHAHAATRSNGNLLKIDNTNFDELEDLGFKSSKGNTVADPQFKELPKEWLDRVTRQMVRDCRKPPIDQINKLRSAAGLSAEAAPAKEPERKPPPEPKSPYSSKPEEKPAPPPPADSDAPAFAPRISVADALQFRCGVTQGAHPIPMKVEFAAVSDAAQSYTKIDWPAVQKGDPSLEGKRVSLLAAIDREMNWHTQKDLSEEQYAGFLVDHYTDKAYDQQVHVPVRKGSRAYRALAGGEKMPNALAPDLLYYINGVYRTVDAGSRQKATIVVESITPAPLDPPPTPRKKGKDYYVRAGSSGGDGSKEQPFRDPFQALDKAAAGDVIHVVGGDYFGKLKTALWRFGAEDLTLLGGYDEKFTARDPWKNPTRLVLADKSKGAHLGPFLASTEPAGCFVLDGFIFDGSTKNEYLENGGLDLRKASMDGLVQLIGRELVIRNCAFLNANGAGLEASAVAGTLENCLFLNCSGMAARINNGNAGSGWTISNNTFLFASDPTSRAGTGMTSAGTLLSLSGNGRLRIRNNYFAFADNFALRTTADPAKVELTGNVFGPTLAFQYTNSRDLWITDATWNRRLAEAGFLKVENNSHDAPPVALDPAFAEPALNRLAKLPSQFSLHDWRAIGTKWKVALDLPTSQPAAPPPPKNDPKKDSVEDLLADLDKLKKDSAKTAEVPKGPAYAPAYDWKKALNLIGDANTKVGARTLAVRGI